MNENAVKNPTSSKHYVLEILEQAAKHGFSKEKLLTSAGFTEQEMQSSHNRVDTYKLAQLVKLAWDSLQDENLGFSKTPCKPGTFYLMGRLTVHEPVLEKAMRQGIRFYQQFVPDYTVDLTINQDIATFSLIQKDPHLDPNHVLTELILIAWHRYCSWLIDQDITLIEASFSLGGMDEFTRFGRYKWAVELRS